ncbi:MAG TPA: methionine synthase [Acidimicrobiales bacterium]|nr:methionine synthase [Acidimicrobiales bacterium]
MSDFLDLIAQRVVVYDGATGTWLQEQQLTADDFGGDALEGCNEYLGITRPDVVRALHAAYFEVGADVVETNTFGSFAIPLGEYDLADRAHEITLANTRLAREVADDFSTADRRRFIAGSMGPGTKFASLGQIPFANLRDAYEVQADALISGGVDVLIIETQFDLLGLKAAIIGARRAMATQGRSVPIQAQVTIELTGRMLPGTEIGAALAALDPLGIDIIGINCATGPVEMSEHLRHLSQHSRMPISCLPNAGLPSVVDGKMHYDLTAEDFVAHQTRFISELGVQVVGGCCGTTPEFIAQLVDAVTDLEPAAREPIHEPGVTSIYSLVPFDQDTAYLGIGERTNANGSKKFREAMLEGDWDLCLKMATDQVKEGAHVLDVCVDYVGRDGTLDMEELASRFATQVNAPLMIDSTEANVVETALQWIGGRPILNSVNLEDGDAEGTRLDRFLTMAKDYGAAVVCTCIDETGQARTPEHKLDAARQIHDLAVNRYGLEPSDLIFDPLALTLATGIEESRFDGANTIEGIRRIKAELPGVHTTLGLSNISFGLNPAARHVLNSVFLNECTQAGLDSAIVHFSKILPLSRISDEQRDVCLDLIYDRRGTDGALADGDKNYDPLQKLLALFENVQTTKVVAEDRSDWPVDKRLSQRIIDGDREGLEADLDEALGQGMGALAIVNDVLLAGMKVVGDLFGAGEMQLPFVLQSAQTMKASVAHLEPHMEKTEGDTSKGKIVLATVKGDVHDIGKNLVDIILTNNGYDVHNLGIKVSVSDLIAKAAEVDADAIGMSGLLVKSTLVMRDNLVELNDRNLSDIPVVLGGAALTRSYVERDLREIYEGRLFYGKDAFEGLDVMDRLGEIRRGETTDDDWGVVPSDSKVPSRLHNRVEVDDADLPARSPEVVTDNPIFTPPFVGVRMVKGVSIDDVAAYLNETSLFRLQWQYLPEGARKAAKAARAGGNKPSKPTESDADFKERIRPILREQLDYVRTEDLLMPASLYGYFPCNGDGRDLVIWTDESRTTERTRFNFPRQPSDPFLCIADMVRPIDSGEVDYVAFQIVTMGRRVSERTAELFADNEYTKYLHLHGLSVEMAEAMAEYMHHRIRTEWGFDGEDDESLAGLFRQRYRGGRYSWGYPACPDLEDNQRCAELLGAEQLGIECNEGTGYQFHPEQTTAAVVFHHPRAKYFVAGR